MFQILIVDDTKAVHLFVKSLLAQCHEIKVTSVFDGQEAIDLFKTNTNFDLILLDWEMPRLNGPSTVTQMKERGLTIPVVMMTTKNSPQDIMKMLGMGVAEYLMKPFTIDILFDKLGSVSGKEFSYVV